MGIVIKLNFKHSRFFYEHEDMPINILKRCWVLSIKVFSQAATSQGSLFNCNISQSAISQAATSQHLVPIAAYEVAAPQNLPLGKLTVG